MNQWIDLHMHSLYSDDGEFSPEELVKRCYEQGIKIMAIADHNSIKAVEEGRKAALEYGMTYISALEIDCTYKGINLHVLGYGIDTKDPAFGLLEENVLEQERACSAQKIKLTKKLGFDITKEALNELSKNGVYTGEMFAEVILNDARYKDSELLKPYREGGSRSDNPYVNFYWDYYAQGKSCYTEIIYPSLKEIIELIKRCGGVAVLAHPGNNLKGQFEIIDEMIQLGLQGIEVFSNYHNEETISYFLEKAQNHQLLITCGSDYHGKTKPAIMLGQTRCTIDEHEIEKQLEACGLIQNRQ